MKSSAVKPKEDKNYVIVEDLPPDQIEPFSEWLIGQSTPVIEEEDYRRQKVVWCAFAWDYALWYAYWSKDEVAPKGTPDNDEINFVIANENLHDSGDKGEDDSIGPQVAGGNPFSGD